MTADHHFRTHGEPFRTPGGAKLVRFKLDTTAGRLWCAATAAPSTKASEPLAVLIPEHGKPCDSLAYLLEPLAQAGVSAVSISLPGCGTPPFQSSGQKLPFRTDFLLAPGGGVAAVLDVIAILRGGNDTPVALFGEGLGAATAIAAVMSESSLGVASLLLLHAHCHFGRFPFLGGDLSSFMHSGPRAYVFWAEMGSGNDGRFHPKQPSALQLAKPMGASVVEILCQSLDPSRDDDDAGEDESSSSSSSSSSSLPSLSLTSSQPQRRQRKREPRWKSGGWKNKRVWRAARGLKKYAARAAAAVAAEAKADDGDTRREDAAKLRKEAKGWRDGIAAAIHQDRFRACLADAIVEILRHDLITSFVTALGDDDDESIDSDEGEKDKRTIGDEVGGGEDGHSEDGLTVSVVTRASSLRAPSPRSPVSSPPPLWLAALQQQQRRHKRIEKRRHHHHHHHDVLSAAAAQTVRFGVGVLRSGHHQRRQRCSFDIHPSLHGGASFDEPLPLRVGERVMAAPGGEAAALGAQTVVRRYRQRQEESSSSSSGGGSNNRRRQLMFSWGEPPAMLEATARRAFELTAPPLMDGAMQPATVISTNDGSEGGVGTYGLRFDSGGSNAMPRFESHVHRLRIAALPHEGDNKGSGGSSFLSRPSPSLFSRPSHPCELRTVRTRRFPGAAAASECSVRILGNPKGPPVLLLHELGAGPHWSRDMACLFLPLVRLGYRVIAPDLPGYGRSPGTVLVANTPAALLKAQEQSRERNGDDHDSDDESDESDEESTVSSYTSLRPHSNNVLAAQADSRWPASHEEEHRSAGNGIDILEDILKDAGWIARATPSGDEPNMSSSSSSLCNAKLDIVAIGAGAGLALSFMRKHAVRESRTASAQMPSSHRRSRRLPQRRATSDASDAAAPTHGGVGGQSSGGGGGDRIGCVVLINPLYRSGHDDRRLEAEAAAQEGAAAVTASRELSELSEANGCHARVAVLGVFPDPERPLSAAKELAPKIGGQGATFEEVALPIFDGDLDEHAAGTVEEDGERDVGVLGSRIRALRNASRHCFEAHSGLVVPRVINFMLRWGTVIGTAMAAPNSSAGAAEEESPQRRRGHGRGGSSALGFDEFGGGVRLLSPTRRGLPVM